MARETVFCNRLSPDERGFAIIDMPLYQHLNHYVDVLKVSRLCSIYNIKLHILVDPLAASLLILDHPIILFLNYQ